MKRKYMMSLKKYFILCIALSIPISVKSADKDKLPGFGISPSKIRLESKPGQTIHTKISLIPINMENILDLTITVNDLNQNLEGNLSPVSKGLGVRSCANWIIVQNNVIIRGDKFVEIPIIINYPHNVSGEYFSYITIKYEPPEIKEKYYVQINPSLSVRIEATVIGKGPMNLDVNDFKIESSSNDNEFKATFLVCNTGVWKANIEGDVLLYDSKALFPIRASIPFKPDGKPYEIFPGKKILLKCKFDALPSPGDATAVVRLLINGRHESVNRIKLTIPKSSGKFGISGEFFSKTENDLDMEVSPTICEVNIIPGAIRVIPIRISNNDNRMAEVMLKIGDVRMEKNGSLTYSANKNSRGDWIDLIPDKFILSPKQTSVAKVQIKVPRDTTGYNSIVKAVQIQAKCSNDDPNSESGAEFGVIIMGINKNTPASKLEITDIKAIRYIEESNPRTAVVQLTNKGGRIAHLVGKVEIKNSENKIITYKEIKESKYEIILPNTKREFRIDIPPLTSGIYYINAEFIDVKQMDTNTVTKSKKFNCTVSIPEGVK